MIIIDIVILNVVDGRGDVKIVNYRCHPWIFL